jgi:hypothetical protein
MLKTFHTGSLIFRIGAELPTQVNKGLSNLAPAASVSVCQVTTPLLPIFLLYHTAGYY